MLTGSEPMHSTLSVTQNPISVFPMHCWPLRFRQVVIAYAAWLLGNDAPSPCKSKQT